MFILTKGEINKFYFIYHFYNWYAFSHNIEGLDTESQDLLKKYLFNPTEKDFNNLQLSDIYKLKDAIKQDKSAIEFVFKLCQQIESSKNALEKLKTMKKNSDFTEDDLKYGETEVQKITDDFVKKVDDVAKAKEQEVMEI